MLLHKYYYNNTELIFDLREKMTVSICKFASILLLDFANEIDRHPMREYDLKICGGESPDVLYLPTHHLKIYLANLIQHHNMSFKFSYYIVEPFKHLSESVYIHTKPIKLDHLKSIEIGSGITYYKSMLYKIHIRALIDQYIKIYMFSGTVRDNSNCASYIPYKIMDGPLTIFESKLCMPSGVDTAEDPQLSHTYNGSFQVSVCYHMLEQVVAHGATLLMKYRTKKLPYNIVNMSSRSNHLSVSFVMSSENRSTYYERWRIFASNPIEIEFVQINKFQGFYSNCLYGGFIIREDWVDRGVDEDLTEIRAMYGPYCSQFGGEPLVNDIKQFQMKSNTSSITSYGYVGYFEIDITVRVKTTSCFGLTNVCVLCKWYCRASLALCKEFMYSVV